MIDFVSTIGSVDAVFPEPGKYMFNRFVWSILHKATSIQTSC